MRLTKLGLALIAILALGAVVANTAMATATESNGFWYAEGTKLTAEEGGQPVVCAQVGEATLSTTVGGKPLKFKATGGTCPEFVIFNEGSKAKGTGKIKLTGVTVVEPAGCTVSGGELETVKLSAQVYMEGTKVLVRFAPASGTVFAEPKVTGCSIAGAYPIKGVEFGEWGNATGVGAFKNSITFSGEINAAAGGSLTVAGQAATIKTITEYYTSHGKGETTKDILLSVSES
jgi:hypothetical protein